MVCCMVSNYWGLSIFSAKGFGVFSRQQKGCIGNGAEPIDDQQVCWALQRTRS